MDSAAAYEKVSVAAVTGAKWFVIDSWNSWAVTV